MEARADRPVRHARGSRRSPSRAGRNSGAGPRPSGARPTAPPAPDGAGPGGRPPRTHRRAPGAGRRWGSRGPRPASSAANPTGRSGPRAGRSMPRSDRDLEGSAARATSRPGSAGPRRRPCPRRGRCDGRSGTGGVRRPGPAPRRRRGPRAAPVRPAPDPPVLAPLSRPRRGAHPSRGPWRSDLSIPLGRIVDQLLVAASTSRITVGSMTNSGSFTSITTTTPLSGRTANWAP